MSAVPSFGNNWDFYPRKIGGADYSVRYNVGAFQLSAEHRAAFPHTMVLHISFLAMRENGFPTHEEIKRINSIEDAFNLNDDSLRHIGVITGNGETRFVFCGGGKPDKLEKKGRKLMLRQKAEYTLQMLPDDNFGYFNNVLSPSLCDMNWMADRTVCNVLQEKGDTLTAPREIDFFIYFKHENDIDKIAAKLKERGFSERSREKMEDGSFGLELTLEAIPSLQNINEITSGILNLLEGIDANFDGWGCTAVTE